MQDILPATPQLAAGLLGIRSILHRVFNRYMAIQRIVLNASSTFISGATPQSRKTTVESPANQHSTTGKKKRDIHFHK